MRCDPPKKPPNSLPASTDLSRVLALRASDIPQDPGLQDRLLGALRRTGADHVVLIGGGGDRFVARLIESGYVVSLVTETDGVVSRLAPIQVSDWIAAWSWDRLQ